MKWRQRNISSPLEEIIFGQAGRSTHLADLAATRGATPLATLEALL